jgi:hypothetical protein
VSVRRAPLCHPCPSYASMAARARLRALRRLGPVLCLVLSAVACSCADRNPQSAWRRRRR